MEPKILVGLSENQQTGEHLNNVLHGLGFARFRSGGFYVGEWLENKQTGKGIQTWGDQSECANHWYFGDVLGGIKQGEGAYFWPDGQKFIGSWSKGVREGLGTMIEADGTAYIGNFHNGERSGFGRLYLSSGVTYIGEWLHDKRNGKGKTIFHDGSIFQGEYKNDLLEGHGLELDGLSKYEGSYQGGLKNGFGKYKSHSGLYYEGFFKNDNFDGTGHCIWPDGSSFKGSWVTGKPNGLGLYTTAHGASYEGVWKMGFSIGVFEQWVASEINVHQKLIERIEFYLAELEKESSEINDLMSSQADGACASPTIDHIETRSDLELKLFAASELAKQTNLALVEFAEIIEKDIFINHQKNTSGRPYCCGQDGYDQEVKPRIFFLARELVPSVYVAHGYCSRFKDYEVRTEPTTIAWYPGKYDVDPRLTVAIVPSGKLDEEQWLDALSDRITQLAHRERDPLGAANRACQRLGVPSVDIPGDIGKWLVKHNSYLRNRWNTWEAYGQFPIVVDVENQDAREALEAIDLGGWVELALALISGSDAR